MNRFVRTGNYGDPVPVYSPGIDYNRQANDAEMEVMFTAIMHSALDNRAVVRECLYSLRSVRNNKDRYANYDRVYEHHLTVYVVAKLTPLADHFYTEADRRLSQNSLVAEIESVVSGSPPYVGCAERILKHKVFEKALKKCQESIRKKDASAREPYKKTWEDEVVEAIYTTPPRTISTDVPSSTRAILGLYSTDGTLLGKYGKLGGKSGLSSSMRPVYVLSHHLGLGGHLAPTLFFENEGEVIYCEKFIKLFDDEAEEKRYTYRIPSMGSSEAHALGRLTELKRKRKRVDVSRFSPQRQPSEQEFSGFLESVSQDSIDDLFLHQILLGSNRYVGPNFSLQYQNDQLCLVRIDYGGEFLEECSKDFFGSSSPRALKPFGEKGQQTIGDLDKLLNNPNLWKKSTLDGFTPEKQYKLRQRLWILHTMHQRGFFTEQHSRLETMAALFYVALRASIEGSKSNYPFVGDYSFTQNLDLESMEEDHGIEGLKMYALGNLLYAAYDHSPRRLELTTEPPLSADLDITLIEQAIHDWMTLPVKQRPLIKEEYAKVDRFFTPDGALRIKKALA